MAWQGKVTAYETLSDLETGASTARARLHRVLTEKEHSNTQVPAQREATLRSDSRAGCDLGLRETNRY